MTALLDREHAVASVATMNTYHSNKKQHHARQSKFLPALVTRSFFCRTGPTTSHRAYITVNTDRHRRRGSGNSRDRSRQRYCWQRGYAHTGRPRQCEQSRLLGVKIAQQTRAGEFVVRGVVADINSGRIGRIILKCTASASLSLQKRRCKGETYLPPIQEHGLRRGCQQRY
jgi:hypothetical protein